MGIYHFLLKPYVYGSFSWRTLTIWTTRLTRCYKSSRRGVNGLSYILSSFIEHLQLSYDIFVTKKIEGKHPLVPNNLKRSVVRPVQFNGIFIRVPQNMKLQTEVSAHRIGCVILYKIRMAFIKGIPCIHSQCSDWLVKGFPGLKIAHLLVSVFGNSPGA